MGQSLESLLASIASPLVAVDNATIYLVSESSDSVHLHLGGAYAGCPSNGFVERSLLAPLVRNIHPHAKLTVTSSLPIPSGAKALR